MKTKKVFLSVLLVFLTLALVACSKVAVTLKGDQRVEVGKTIVLTPEASGKNITLTWASSDSSIASVQDGVVTGLKEGQVKITVTASSGKKSAEASLDITVFKEKTNTNPVISGAADKQIEKGSAFDKRAGVSASDAEDGDLTEAIQVTGEVDTSVAGAYEVTYSVTDADNNTVTVKITVTVVETKTNTPPVISGATDKTIEKGTTFVPLEGITATDAEDGDLTKDIKYVGNVNPRAVGEYEATYSVTDSDNNTVSVKITVTVVFTDADAPLLTGTQNKAIVVGDASFKLTDGVLASDTVDGDVTNQIVIEGSVDIWKLGDYSIKYSVSDEAGNKAEATRVITVGLGDFIFFEPIDITLDDEHAASVSGGTISGQLTDYALAKLTFKANASAAGDLVIALPNSTTQDKVALVSGENNVTVYFRVAEAIVNGKLQFTLPEDVTIQFSEMQLAFGDAKDEIAPRISAPDTAVVLPGNVSDANVLKSFILNGVSATDNIDGIITAKLNVDFGNIELGNCFTDQEVTIYVVDTSGNRTEVKRAVSFVNVYDTKLIADPTFTEDVDWADHDNGKILGWSLNGGGGNPELKVENGLLVHHNTTKDNPGWDSASSPCFRTNTDVLNSGNWYMLKFDVKAEVARKMTVRIGLDTTEGAGWIENFNGANNTPFNLTTDWQTCYVLFYIHADTSEVAGYNTVKFELKIGTFTWGGEEQGNTVYFDNLQVYLLTNDNHAPVLTIDPELPTTFAKGADKPDLTQYVSAFDREDAASIAIAASNITEAINMAEAGVYDVVYTVADSEGEEATLTLKIKVLEEADTVAPVLAEAENIVKTYNQFGEAPDLTTLITANDAVDGAIAIEERMITTAFDINKAGSFEVKYTVKDSSGIAAELTITLVVNDKEAPKITGSSEIKVYEGTELTANDIIYHLLVNDNIDGEMLLEASGIKDLDKVDFAKAGEYAISVEATDAAGNKATFNITVVVRAKAATKPVINAVLIDLAAMEKEVDQGNGGSVTYGTEEATIDITSVGTYASYTKIKYSGLELEKGKTYVLKFVAKADEARRVKMNLGIGLWADPWFDYFSLAEGNSEYITLTTEYAEYTIMFTYDETIQSRDGGPSLEFCLGTTEHEGDKAGNKVYFKELAIYSTKEEVIGGIEPVVLDDFESYADQAAVAANWAKRYDGANYNTGFDVLEVEGNKVVKFEFGSDKKYLLRYIGTFPTLTDDYKYVRFHAQFASEETQTEIWLYWDGNQMGYQFTPKDIKASDGYYYVPISKWGKTASQITGFAIGFNYKAGAVAYFDDIEFTASKPDSVAPVISVAKELQELVAAGLKFEADTDLRLLFNKLCVGITATDDNDGEIFILQSMIDLDGLNLAKAANGSYKIKFNVSDAAGNSAKLEIPVIVGDIIDPVILIDGSLLEEAEELVGTYKFGFKQAQVGEGGTWLFADGTVNDSGYLATTTDFRKAASFVIALVEGKTDEYTIKVGNKYLEIYETSDQKVRLHLVDEATGVWKFDEDANVFTFALAGCAKASNDGVYYFGTYNKFETMSASKTSYITGSNASKVGVSQFPAQAYKDLLVEGYKFAAGTDLRALFAQLLAGLSASDDVDGEIEITTDNANLGGLNLQNPFAGLFKVKVEVSDAAGNKDSIVLPVRIVGENGLVADLLPRQVSGEKANIVYDEETGAATITVTDVGQWASYAKAKYVDLGLEYGKTYELQIKVKADRARNLQFRVGIGLWADPWIDDFTYVGGSDPKKCIVLISDQYVVYKVRFTFDKEDRQSGPLVEFSFGNTYHGGDKTDNKIYVESMVIYEIDPKFDINAPVISLSQAVQTALNNSVFMAGESIVEELTALKQGLSAVDDYDGEIAITDEMIDLGGLNPQAPVAGNYKIKVTVKDSKNNEAVLEIPVRISQDANLTLDFSDGTVGSGYTNASWKQEYYGTAWTATSGKMNCREKDSVRVVNFFTGSSMTYRYTYNESGNAIGFGNRLSLKVGNYYDSPQVIKTKIIIVDVKGNRHYVLGSENAYYEFPATAGLEDVVLGFETVEVQAIVVVVNSTKASAYLYVGDVHLINDKVKPVITVSNEVQAAVAAGLQFDVGTDLRTTFAGLLAGLSATDDVDGDIAITNEMIDLDGLNLESAEKGLYTVKVTVKDGALNEASVELPVSIGDNVKPVITISEQILAALASKTFTEGDDESATFTAFMAGVSATDDVDGNIAITPQMFDLGGLNPANLVKGDYVITITVSDAAENVATKEVKIHVVGEANVDLFADHPNQNSGSYASANWKQEKYDGEWKTVTGQMNARQKDGVNVVNMVSGYSNTYRYTYNTGVYLGKANTLSFKVGNYFSGAKEYGVKVVILDKAGNSHYILGDASNFYNVPVTTGLVDQVLTFDDIDVYAVRIVCKSTLQASAYLYVGELNLKYEDPACDLLAEFLDDVNASAIANEYITEAVSAANFYSKFAHNLVGDGASREAWDENKQGILEKDATLLAKWGWLIELAQSGNLDNKRVLGACNKLGLEYAYSGSSSATYDGYSAEMFANNIHNLLNFAGTSLHSGSSSTYPASDWSDVAAAKAAILAAMPSE